MAKVGVEDIKSSPLLQTTSRRRLSAAPHRLLAAQDTNVKSNAADGDAATFMVTQPGAGMFWEGSLTTRPMKVSQVKLTNAPAGKGVADAFTLYRVLVDGTACGTTAAKVKAGDQVVVNCGTAPNYISGSKVRVETTTKTNLQLAEVEVIGTDGSKASIDKALKANAGKPCTVNGFNSCFNELARAAHNDYREGLEWEDAKGVVMIAAPLEKDDVRAKALQTQMDAATFTGVASQLTVPAECSMNIYTERHSTETASGRGHAASSATDNWYHSGEPYYDYATGQPKTAATAEQKVDALKFTRMMWKATKKVAFGIKGKHVVAWYCDAKGNIPATDAKVFKANVGAKNCLKFDPISTKITENSKTGAAKDRTFKVYNQCYNDRQMKFHNTKRQLHEARDLSFDKEASIEIQKILNAMTRGDAVEMPTSSTRPKDFRECGQNIFTGATAVAAFTTAAATDDWYAGHVDYDFSKHAPKGAK